MIPKTSADVTGDGAAHTLASVLGVTQCKWFQVSAVTIASTAARVGDADVALTSEGFPIGGGGGVFAPPIALPMSFYDLTQWYFIAANNDKLAIGCAV